jgi:hypothetical protein
MLEKALLLTGDPSSSDDGRAERLLEFFGVSFQRQSTKDFKLLTSSPIGGSMSYRLVCAAQTFASVIGELQNGLQGATEFARHIHSVFLYSTVDAAATARVASQFCRATISISKGSEDETEWRIADDASAIFGAMRGLRIHLASATLNSSNLFVANEGSQTALIGAANKVAFLKTTWNDVPVFVSSERLIDIDAELTTPNFDVRDHFFSAVPVVSYIRWAFTHSSWNAPEANACLVIDDPLLRTRYGFLRFRELLALMKQVRFSTSIAFIPWNWRRSDPKVVQLFKDNPSDYSLCIHGCDHTAGEFGTSNERQLRAIASEAVRRMCLHEQRTGLAHDRVMVFPQGIFSEQAILELKRANFSAVVNTEVHSNLLKERKLRISDVWDVAVMSYGDFPIYTRRYPDQGVENLAFDVLLGKPCLVVIHHDFFSNGYDRLAQFIDQLNALNVSLVWRRLSEVVRCGYRQKKLSSDCVEIEMYGSELLIENRSGRAMSYFVRRRERETNSVESVYAGSRCVPWNSAGDHMEFKLDLAPGESTLLRLLFKPAEDVAQARQNLAHSAKIVLRRYLSEARDNYLMPAKARMVTFSRS